MAKKTGPQKAKKAPEKRSPKKKDKRTAEKKKPVKRAKSKLTVVHDPEAPRDESPEAFRPDKFLKQYLNEQLGRGEKSNFIIEALYEKIARTEEVTCPMCKGQGKIGTKVKLVKD